MIPNGILRRIEQTKARRFLAIFFSGTEGKDENVRQSVMQVLPFSDWQRLYQSSEAQEIGLTLEAFREALAAVAGKFLPAPATASQQNAFYEKLHLKDFALAQACSCGNAVAWERFFLRFRGRLYAAALVLSREEETARDLVDSLAGDLFVTEQPSVEGLSSKLATYSGRGSLEGWLKALLTNTYIDRYRSQQRIVSLEQRIDILANLCARQDAVRQKTDPRLSWAVEQAFRRCTPQERFLLTAYFFDRWTLKEIATALGVHESSASRRMDRLLRELRRSILRHLQKEGMSYTQARELLQMENWDLTVDVRGLLLRGFARE
jgi:RNA polymerase sigma-70 factor (ECF subfamily)